MPAPQQAEKILEKKQTFAWRSLEFTPSNVLVSQAAQPYCRPAPSNPSSELAGTAVSVPPCSGTQLSPCGRESLTVNSPSSQKKGYFPTQCSLSQGLIIVQKGVVLNSYRTSTFCTQSEVGFSAGVGYQQR